jgi:STE24 endopeptidase
MTSSLSPSNLLTAAFVTVLVLSTLVRFWLASRQIRHVARHRDQVPPEFAQSIPLTAHQKAADYTIAKTRLGLIELALGGAVVVAWTLLGGLDALNGATLLWVGPGMLQQITLMIAFVVIGSVIDLPMSWYQTFVLEERFGFNKMRIGLWLADLVKSALIGAAIGIPLIWLILWLMGAAGNLWWLWAWSVWMGFNLLLLLVYPTFIAPIFNKFKPLEDETVRTRVTALMERCGFAAKGLFVMDGSKRSAHANAYFTGFGAAKRVVFYDTLLARLSAPEVDAVLAHELGHFRHRHVIKRIVSMFVLSLLAFALLGWLSGQAWFYTALGVRPNMVAGAPNDALALLLFMLATPAFGFFISPLFTRLSRKHEFEADAFAVAQTSGTDLSAALLKLYEDNASTLTPDPVYVRFYYSHPPAIERLTRMHA